MDAVGSITTGRSRVRLRVAGSENVTRNPYAHRTSFPDVDDGHPGGTRNGSHRSPWYPGGYPSCFVGARSKFCAHRCVPAVSAIPHAALDPTNAHGCPAVQFASTLHTATSPPGAYAGLSSVADALSAPPVMNDREPLDAGPAAGFEPGDA